MKVGMTIMTIKILQKGDATIAVIESSECLITDVQSALDLMATVRYETDCDKMILPKTIIADDFFILSTRLAGEVLQKFANYRMKLAVVGDYSGYTSKPLRDFIYESNNGNDVFFVSTEEEAVQRLVKAK